MTQKAKVVVKNKVGLHARPAALFVQTARKYDSTIRVGKEGKFVDAKSILEVLSLGVECADTIEIIVDGPSEEEALYAIVNLINELKD